MTEKRTIFERGDAPWHACQDIDLAKTVFLFNGQKVSGARLAEILGMNRDYEAIQSANQAAASIGLQ